METNRVNETFSVMEQELTRAGDQLDVLMVEQAQLWGRWQGEAESIWCEAFQKKLSETEAAVKESVSQVNLLKELAAALLVEEKKVSALIDAL